MNGPTALQKTLPHEPRTRKQRNGDWRSRLSGAGLRQVSVWIPWERVAELHGVAERMRQESGVPTPGDGRRRRNDGVLAVADAGTARGDGTPWTIEESGERE